MRIVKIVYEDFECAVEEYQSGFNIKIRVKQGCKLSDSYSNLEGFGGSHQNITGPISQRQFTLKC